MARSDHCRQLPAPEILYREGEVDVVRWIDVLGTVALVEFVLLGLVAVAQWWRYRAVGARWAAATFGLLGAVALIGRVLRETATIPSPWMIKGLVAALVLVPFSLYRFATTFRPASRSVDRAANAVTAAVLVATALLPHFPVAGMPRPWWLDLYRVGFTCQWALLFSYVAVRLWRAGGEQPRAARNRMRLLAAGAVGLNTQIIVDVLGLRSHLEVALATQVLTVLMAALFTLGLTFPATVRYWWRRKEDDEVQTALADLVKVTSVAEVAGGLLPEIARLIGASRIELLDGSGHTIAAHGEDALPSPTAEEAATVELALSRGYRLRVAASPYIPYFGRDEMRALAGIGDLLVLAMERCLLAESERRSRAELAHLALHDALTGLPNRAALLRAIADAVDPLRTPDHSVAVLFIDLDRFKLINDGIDHVAGDEVLVSVAERLRGALRADDVVARLGGDEFVVLAAAKDVEEAVAVARRLADAVSRRDPLRTRSFTVTASIGVVMARSGDDPIALLRDADAAMYHAKANGRNRIDVFTDEMRADAIEHLDLECRLRDAVIDEQFFVAYQPSYRLSDGVVTGIEALVRWQHPDRGLLGPDQFISVAEESGAIVELGTWVLESACHQMAAWRASIPVLEEATLWVNASGRQFQSGDFPSIVETALASSGLGAEHLGIEITETVFMANAEDVAEAVHALRRLGVSVAIDDFGTGYSSLTYLTQLPVDVVKIDGSFVQSIGETRDAAVVTACLALARSIGARTIAEGVETRAQLDWLRLAGCDDVQGFLLSRPLDVAAATMALGARCAVGSEALSSAPR
jgi:diguanylate cyclase (GGDEF)-like protein